MTHKQARACDIQSKSENVWPTENDERKKKKIARECATKQENIVFLLFFFSLLFSCRSSIRSCVNVLGVAAATPTKEPRMHECIETCAFNPINKTANRLRAKNQHRRRRRINIWTKITPDLPHTHTRHTHWRTDATTQRNEKRKKNVLKSEKKKNNKKNREERTIKRMCNLSMCSERRIESNAFNETTHSREWKQRTHKS